VSYNHQQKELQKNKLPNSTAYFMTNGNDDKVKHIRYMFFQWTPFHLPHKNKIKISNKMFILKQKNKTK
jgi:hypothetical protein